MPTDRVTSCGDYSDGDSPSTHQALSTNADQAPSTRHHGTNSQFLVLRAWCLGVRGSWFPESSFKNSKRPTDTLGHLDQSLVLGRLQIPATKRGMEKRPRLSI